MTVILMALVMRFNWDLSPICSPWVLIPPPVIDWTAKVAPPRAALKVSLVDHQWIRYKGPESGRKLAN